MAFYLGGKEIIVQEVPILPKEAADAHYLKMDLQDETTGEWWELYKWENKLYKGRANNNKYV